MRRLTEEDRAEAQEFLAAHLLTGILAAVNLPSLSAPGQSLLAVGREPVQAVAWSGYNFVPVGSADAMGELADYCRRRPRRASSIVGQADVVMRLWAGLEGAWGAAREIRSAQPALVHRVPSRVAPDDRLRPATEEDFDRVLPASAAMFLEEVGYDPMRNGSGYSAYVRGLIRQRRTYVVVEPLRGQPTVVFKADVGAVWGGLAQIQGVWTHPALRGRGLGTAGMAAVVERVAAEHAPEVSLYVNDYNLTARRVYAKVGFRQEDTYATILF